MRQRILPLVLFGWALAATRLILDFTAPDWPPTMHIGVFFTLPFFIAYIGLMRKWGRISWPQMALSMLLVGFLVWGIWNSIAYTTGQFMEWTHGRFDPGTPTIGADGVTTYEGGRASPIQAESLGKIGQGLLHGLVSSVAGSVWCILFGSVFIWVPAMLGRGENRQVD